MITHRLEGYRALGELRGELTEDELVTLDRSSGINTKGFSSVTCVALYLA